MLPNDNMDGRKVSTDYAALRLSHAKSLQDISELRKLRDSVGKNILEACMLVDVHQRGLSEHYENLKRTREHYSVFERKLSNATSNSGYVPPRRRYMDGNCTSSGDESLAAVLKFEKPSRSRSRNTGLDDFKSQQYYNSSSDAQSLSSACSFSPKETRKNSVWKQIAVPIYEDSVDSGVSLATVSPGFCDHAFISDDDFVRQSSRNVRNKGRTFAYESDASSSMSHESSRYGKQGHRKNENYHNPFILSNTWRSTPNIIDEENQQVIRRSSVIISNASDCASAPCYKASSNTRTNGKLRGKTGVNDWKSLPELAAAKKNESDSKKTKEKRKKGRFLHLLRRLTKSGEYVLKDESNEAVKKNRKKNTKSKTFVNSSISCPALASALGKTTEVIDGEQTLYRVEINKPSNGLHGFYVQQGYKKSRKGIFIGSFVNSQIEKLYSGILRKGDELIELNGLNGDRLSLKNVLDILSNANLLNAVVLPYSNRKK